MGFGSYDESEQQNQDVDTELDDDETVDARESDHQGSVQFEFGESEDELLDRLAEIKED
ncbi:MAG: DUF5786 family protein [Haloarculaceae archaeon]